MNEISVMVLFGGLWRVFQGRVSSWGAFMFLGLEKKKCRFTFQRRG